MTTGADIKRVFNTKIFKSYSNFYNDTKLNDLFKESLNLSITDVYKDLAEQIDYDYLISVVRTEQVFGLNNNKIFVLPVAVSAIDITNPLLLIVTTTEPHNLVNNDIVEFSDVAGLTTAPVINTNTFTVTVTGTTTFTIITTSATGTHTANTGSINTITQGGVSKMIPDYSDLLSLKASYNQKIDVKVLSASNAIPIRIKVDKRNNINTGERLKIEGVQGNTNANGDYYVRVINSFEFDLYVDRDLTLEVQGNGKSANTGTIKRIFYKVATPYISSRKVSAYEDPSVSLPQFERADSKLKIYPADKTCTEITIDYIRSDFTAINVTDSAVDLELTYPYEFLVYIIDKATKIFFAQTKDFNSMQAATVTEQQAKAN